MGAHDLPSQNLLVTIYPKKKLGLAYSELYAFQPKMRQAISISNTSEKKGSTSIALKAVTSPDEAYEVGEATSDPRSLEQ